ncbi:hypothetical protein NC99_45370 [Sunxiuqinia dokdonensis]|uniref:Uncharacterized protein n=1 Tax=Sunxiuqinia dokdonensis TaxID=1409788 RepID=A0A0L8V2N1_9BACT|nr:hypothetical protein NC99_45370 [Sunxiuqinia dokdonensis]
MALNPEIFLDKTFAFKCRLFFHLNFKSAMNQKASVNHYYF